MYLSLSLSIYIYICIDCYHCHYHFFFISIKTIISDSYNVESPTEVGAPDPDPRDLVSWCF